MKNIKILTIVILLGFSSRKTNAQQSDNTKPMYGEVAKSDEHKKLDEDFIKKSLSQFGTIDSSAKVYVDHAWRYFYHNDLNTAMKRFNQTWLLKPELADSYFGFAAIMDIQGNTKESNRFYKIALEKDNAKKRSNVCYQKIADCFEQLNNTKGAIEAYNKIISNDNTNSFAFKKVGYLRMESGNNKDALKAYNSAIELDPTDAITYSNRAYLHQSQKEFPMAIADYTKVIELDPTNVGAFVNRGISEMDSGKLMEAKKDFETSISFDEMTPDLRRLLGLTKVLLNDENGACIEFKKAKELGDTSVDELVKTHCK